MLKAYIGPFIITFLIAMFVFEMQFIWLYLDDLLGKGLNPMTVLELIFYASARIVNMALPLAVLMSSIMTFGALAENNELTAMKSAGMSLSRIFRPLVVLMLLLSLGSFFFANNMWPIANLKFRTLLFSIVQQRPALSIENGVFYNGIEGVSIRVMEKNPDTGMLKDILIYDHRNQNGGNKTVIKASEGEMTQTEDKRFLILTLRNGATYDEKEESSKPKRIVGKSQQQQERSFPYVHGNFQEMVIRLDLSNLVFKNNDEEIFKNSFEMMTIPQLERAIDSLQIQRDSLSSQINQATQPNLNESTVKTKNAQTNLIERQKEELANRNKFINRHKIEWHRKFTLAISCLILFFIGAPLGALIRKGGLGWPTVIALGIFILFEMLTIAGEKMTKSELLPPHVGMWLATYAMLPAGIYITWRAQMEGKWKWNFFKLRKK